ncbi:hypothetical protein HDV03_003829 [Kappamyces sp. JEL0829]|nr:hypothetical protein HDV03_003829 [Kappamyces sp. JEL0829]
MTQTPLLTKVENVAIAVIGGSGLYSLDNLQVLGEYSPETPWGKPSDNIVIAQTEKGTKVAFLARHGRGHYLTPTEVPSRANIAALKHIGCKVVLAFSAVGSLREEIAPRDFVIPNQIIDRTKGIRDSTFFENGFVGHVMFADPFSNELGELIDQVRQTIPGAPAFHTKKTLVCMEDIINMSVIPEAKLAREAELAYQMVCMSTDYDCWKESEEPVSVEAVIANLTGNASFAKTLLATLIPVIADKLEKGTLKCVKELENSTVHACMTSGPKKGLEQIKKMQYMLPNLQ